MPMLLTTLGAIVAAAGHFGLFLRLGDRADRRVRGRMHQLEKDGSRAARDVNRLVADREQLIGAVLLGNTFINILASSLATALAGRPAGPPRRGGDHRGDDRGDPGFRRSAAQDAWPSPAPTVSRWRWRRRCAGWCACWRRSSATVQWLVWRVLFLFGVEPRKPGRERPKPRMKKFAAPWRCITRKAASSANIAT